MIPFKLCELLIQNTMRFRGDAARIALPGVRAAIGRVNYSLASHAERLSMQALLMFFIDLARLRRGPQDLPASSALLILLASLSIILGTVNGAQMFGGVNAALGANLLDLLLTMTMLFVLLQFTGHAARWLQTTNAFLGLGVLAGSIMLLVKPSAEALGVSDVAMLVDLVLVVWLHVALGNVLRHALEIPMLAGVLIVLSYTVMAFSLIARVFPLVGAN